MAEIEFKHAGITIEEDGRRQKRDEKARSEKPIGFVTPLRLGSIGVGPFAMHTDVARQIDDNLRNLILTNRGERLGLHDFGADLRPLAAEISSQEDFDSTAVDRISIAVAKWMPFVALKTFESFIDRDQNQHVARVRIRVRYDIPLLDKIDRAIDVIVYAI